MVHQIEADDTLSWANAAWWQFAKENNASLLTPETVLGRSLWEFITEATTRQFYQIIVKRARTLMRKVELTYRCDSPEKRRFMRMEVHPMSGGQLQFRNWIVREEIRPPLPLLTLGSHQGESLITMCSWCKRVKSPVTLAWLEPEEAVSQLQLFHYTAPPMISHGICPDCEKKVEAEVESLG